MAKSRGVRGAAGFCAVASLVYLLVRSLLYALVSTLMGLAHPGASMAKPLGFSEVSLALFQLIIGLGAIGLTLVFMMKLTRLRSDDLRLTLPAPWSPGFCLPVFLGVANLANLAGALINHITGSETTAQMLPSGGPELFMYYLALCVMPAVAEELLFRGAFQGLMRPSGSAAAIWSSSRRWEDCAAAVPLRLTTPRKPIRSTTPRGCASGSRRADCRSRSPTYGRGWSIRRWPKARGCSGCSRWRRPSGRFCVPSRGGVTWLSSRGAGASRRGCCGICPKASI